MVGIALCTDFSTDFQLISGFVPPFKTPRNTLYFTHHRIYQCDVILKYSFIKKAFRAVTCVCVGMRVHASDLCAVTTWTNMLTWFFLLYNRVHVVSWSIERDGRAQQRPLNKQPLNSPYPCMKGTFRLETNQKPWRSQRQNQTIRIQGNLIFECLICWFKKVKHLFW